MSPTKVVQWATGTTATAMHAVHAVPMVSAASPGILVLADLPVFFGGTK